jgi:hypothetical protein
MRIRAEQLADGEPAASSADIVISMAFAVVMICVLCDWILGIPC